MISTTSYLCTAGRDKVKVKVKYHSTSSLSGIRHGKFGLKFNGFFSFDFSLAYVSLYVFKILFPHDFGFHSARIKGDICTTHVRNEIQKPLRIFDLTVGINRDTGNPCYLGILAICSTTRELIQSII